MLNISPELIKRASLSLALAMTMSMAMAVAQTNSSDTTMVDPTKPETNTMDQYLNNHPGVANQLHNNPSLINNPQWLAQHPKVQNYMNSHPALKTDAAAHPDTFVNKTEHHDVVADHKALNATDAYAREHPEIADQLKNNPKLIDDPKYLADHPGLDKYLAQHPEIRQAAQAHPDTFAKAAEANNKYEKNHRAATATNRK
jgi:hypothetical protein